MKLQQLTKLYHELRSLPEAQVRLWGEGAARQIYEEFTKPHRKYKVIQNKKWGVALIALPAAFDDYLKGKEKQSLRTNRKRALTAGFYFARFSPLERIEEILAINTSMMMRQGKTMDASYTNRAQLQRWLAELTELNGVFNPEHVLKAYTHTPILGELFIFSRILGHAEALDDGIMYLLVSEVIREMIEQKIINDTPHWAMYDTFLGAAPGLRYFKERLGFKPYRAHWQWVGAPSKGGL